MNGSTGCFANWCLVRSTWIGRSEDGEGREFKLQSMQNLQQASKASSSLSSATCKTEIPSIWLCWGSEETRKNPKHRKCYCYTIKGTLGFSGGASGKEPICQCRRHERCRFSPWVGKFPWRRKWQPIPVFLPGESHGQRNLVGYSPSGHKSQTWLKQLSTHARTQRDLQVTEVDWFPSPCCTSSITCGMF